MVSRLPFIALLLATTAGMEALLWQALGSEIWLAARLAMALLFLPIAIWLGICVGNAIPGFLILVLARRAARIVLPVTGDIEHAPLTLRTAIAVTVRNEDIAAVIDNLTALLAGLDDPAHFAGFILSDTQDPALASAEALAAQGRPVTYRRRSRNTGFKAGNVMEFLDHHAEGFDVTLMLDADSTMAPASVRRLVRIMQADPRMGLVQHLTAGRPAEAAFARLFQFGMRSGMRVWSVGQALWQGRAGPYWGHNAIFRNAPFRELCRLDPLPDGSVILSHDQVEAARLAAAGWGVAVWAEDAGSYEANPPAMPEFLHRDGRWLAGNMQYRHLIVLPGFTVMGRWQLLQAMLLFAGAPLYALMFLLAVALAGHGGSRGALVSFALAWALTLYAPKLLGYLETLLFPTRRAAYGGGWRFLAGALAETLFTLLLDAPSYISKSLALLRLILGAKPGWLPQNRSARGVAWGEAARLFWPHTLIGVVTFAALLRADPGLAFLAFPFAGGLLLVIPFCVLTASPRVSAWLRARGVCAMPEEV